MDVDLAIERGAAAVFAKRRPDGSFRNPRPTSPLATAGAITALHVADPDGARDLVEAGARWLRDNRNADGGWGGVRGAATRLVPTVAASCALTATTGAPPEEHDLSRLGDPAMLFVCQLFRVFAGLEDAEVMRRIPLAAFLVPAVRRKRLSFRTAPVLAMGLMQSRKVGVAQRNAMRVLRRWREHEGLDAGIAQDPWPTAWVCMALARRGLMPELVADFVAFLRRTAQPDGSWHVLTNIELTGAGYAVKGLVRAGFAADPLLRATRGWLHRCQQTSPFEPFGVPAGGWSFSDARGFPAVLETAQILGALAGLPGADDRGLDWLAHQQDSRGSWSTFVRNTKLAQDGPDPYVTATAAAVLREHSPHRTSKAVRWLRKQQHEDGSFESLWYHSKVSGTAAALELDPSLDRARTWLLSVPWPTLEDTAWAVRALLAAGVPADHHRVLAGVAELVERQQEDGEWPAHPVLNYTRNHTYHPDPLMTAGLALQALAAYREAA